MDRDAAIALCREQVVKETTLRHLISVEGVMRSLAAHLGEPEEPWALTGLFHDLDQDVTGDDAEGHAYLAAEWLSEAGLDAAVINGVLAHAHPQFRTDRMSQAVVHADGIAGLLVAAALVRPTGATGMKVSSVRKKLKDRAFAPGVNREDIASVEGELGVPLDEFIEVSIRGLQSVAADIELG